MTGLLMPIAETAPSGESLRFDPAYDEVKRLREEDDPTLPQGVWQRELKKADWNGVAARCTDLLTKRTKDLQIAAWLTEAWIRLEGWGGAARGLRLIAALCREFWESVHPAIGDGGELTARLSPVIWVAERLPLALKMIPITAPTTEDAIPYGWNDWEGGQYLLRLAKRNAGAAASSQTGGMVPQTKFLASLSVTPSARLVKLNEELDEFQDAVAELGAVLDERCGPEAPSLAPLRDLGESVRTFIARTLHERVQNGEVIMETPAAAPAASAVPADPAMVIATATGPVTSRADAYARLREASDYLLRTEPHSPVPYLVRRAISWGDMSLSELLEELLHRNADLPTIYALLGIRKQE